MPKKIIKNIHNREYFNQPLVFIEPIASDWNFTNRYFVNITLQDYLQTISLKYGAFLDLTVELKINEYTKFGDSLNIENLKLHVYLVYDSCISFSRSGFQILD